MAATDFIAANGTLWSALDAAWADMSATNPVSNGEVQNNALQTINGGGDELGGYYSTSSSDYSQATLKAGPYDAAKRFVSVRATGAGAHGYSAAFIQLTGDIFGGVAIYSGTTGTTTWLVNVATGLSISRLVDHTLALSATGTGTVEFEVWVDGVSVGTAQTTGSVIDTGSPGFWSKWIAQSGNVWGPWTDVNTSDAVTLPGVVPDGTTGVLASYTGFVSGPITGVTVDGVSATSVVDGAGSVTFDMPNIAGLTSDAGTVVPNFGAVTFSFSNGTETAAPSASVTAAAGWAVVAVLGLNTLDANYLYSLIAAATSDAVLVADGWEWYYETANSTTVSASGQITTDGTTFKIVAINRVSGDLAYPFQWVNGDIAPASAAQRNITRPITISVRGTPCLLSY